MVGMGKLLSWFGPSRMAIWRRLSEELDARYSKKRWSTGDRIDVDHGPWTITLDVYTVMAGNAPLLYTRFRAPYLNVEEFRMKIYRSSLFGVIGKWFGMQDIEVGSLQFDSDFIVKASDRRMVRRFCGNASLRRQMSAQKSIALSIVEEGGWFGARHPDGTDVLSLVVSGHLKDTERIKELFDLFAEARDQLCDIGAAYSERPDFTL